MTGKRLYELYTQASEDNGCAVDTLEELGGNEEKIWDDFALLVEADTECTTMTLGTADAPGI